MIKSVILLSKCLNSRCH